MNILVSACLLGEKCRYDGKSKPHSGVLALQKKYKVIPVCPEVMGGLSIPHPPAERLGEKVIDAAGQDVTKAFQKRRNGSFGKSRKASLLLCNFEGTESFLRKRRNL